MDAIRARHGEIEAMVGMSLDLPDVADPAILEYFVVEKNGEILGGMYLEKSVRECHFGVSPEATAALRLVQQDLFTSSKAAGVRFVHCDVYRDVPQFDKIEGHLTEEEVGFTRRDELVAFTKDLR